MSKSGLQNFIKNHNSKHLTTYFKYKANALSSKIKKVLNNFKVF